MAALVAAFREVRRVLRDDGLAFLNLGDSFSSGKTENTNGTGGKSTLEYVRKSGQATYKTVGLKLPPKDYGGLGSKQLLGVPWHVAFALQDDGWVLRDALIWSKADMTEDLDIDGGVMPGSQRDRCTFAYEMLFMLAKRPVYYFDRDALRSNSNATLRNVWRINTDGSNLRHFALMPCELARRCVLLSTSARGCCPHCSAPWVRVVERTRYEPEVVPAGVRRVDDSRGDKTRKLSGPEFNCQVRIVGETWRPSCKCPEHTPTPCTVLDPFAGAGTSVLTAVALGRHGIGCDLSHDYLLIARDRIDRPHRPVIRPTPAAGDDLPLFRRMEDNT